MRHWCTSALQLSTMQDLAVGSSRGTSDSISNSVYLTFSTKDELRRTFQSRLLRDPKLKEAVAARKQHSKDLLTSAITEGNLEAMKWLQAICISDDQTPQDLMSVAASNGQLSIMKYFHGPPCNVKIHSQHTMDAREHVECLKWLLSCEPQCMLDPGVIPHFIAAGNLEMLDWLNDHAPFPFDNASRWTSRATTAAAASGSLAVLEYLRSRSPPCTWNADCTLAAIKRKDIHLLRWLRSQDPPCPWNARCTAAAISNLSLEELKEFESLDPTIPWDESCASTAVTRGKFQALRWMRTLDPPCPLDIFSTTAAARRKTPAILKFLCDEGCPLDVGSACITAAAAGSSENIAWLHAHCRANNLQLTFQPEFSSAKAASAPILMLLGDLKAPPCQMGYRPSRKLIIARRTFCTFHGLLRWCRKAVSDPSRCSHRVFDNSAAEASGQELLAHLSLLPRELINKIAVMAELQPDVERQQP